MLDWSQLDFFVDFVSQCILVLMTPNRQRRPCRWCWCLYYISSSILRSDPSVFTLKAHVFLLVSFIWPSIVVRARGIYSDAELAHQLLKFIHYNHMLFMQIRCLAFDTWTLSVLSIKGYLRTRGHVRWHLDVLVISFKIFVLVKVEWLF